MQQIFSQAIRFKADDGSTFPEWKEKKLGDIVRFENGKGHEQNISKDGKFIVVNSKFISSQGRVKKYTDTQKSPLNFGDVVMVMSDVPNGKALAKCYYIEQDNLYSLNQRICGLKHKLADTKFIYYRINRHKYFLSFDSGVGQTNLKKMEILNCPLNIPTDIKEQAKIANFLSSVDNKIEQMGKQLDESKQFKKALLQQMFV
jgi:type I restriction enzyme S subunit